MSVDPVIAYLCHYPFCEFSDQWAEHADKYGIDYSVFDVTANEAPNYVLGTPSVQVDNELYSGDAAFQWLEQNKRMAKPDIQAAAIPMPVETSSTMPRSNNSHRKQMTVPPRPTFEFSNTSARGRNRPPDPAPVANTTNDTPFLTANSASQGASGGVSSMSSALANDAAMLQALSNTNNQTFQSADVLLQQKLAQR
jgi:hypothetical protein